MKKILSIFLAAAVLLLSFSAAVCAQEDIKIYVNNVELSCENTPYIDNNRTMVPMRSIFESLNTSVEWNGEDKTISASNDALSLTLQIGNNELIKNGTSESMEVAPLIVNDTTYVPLRAVSQALGAQVSWDEETKSVYITQTSSYPMAEITMEDGGIMLLELYPDAAPLTVANFIKLVNEDFYDGITFHRIIPGFMAQGGDPTGTGRGGSEESIKGEFAANGIENNLKHERGVISMARNQFPDSANSQFFIMFDEASYLDGQYAAFGKLISGFDVLDKLALTPITDQNGTVASANQPVIKSIEMK